jgi:amidase
VRLWAERIYGIGLSQSNEKWGRVEFFVLSNNGAEIASELRTVAGLRDPLNAFLDLPHVPVPHAESGPLAGLSLAVKDIFHVAGYRTGCGNPQKYFESAIAEETAPAVQALLDAGAQFAGKTQSDELAFSLMGVNVHFPQPVNAAAPDRVTGGSSSGSVAAVTGGLADIGIGSDTGGSIRAPASFCGLVGLRTTQGRISLDGMVPLAPTFDTFGWFAKDLETYEEVGRILLAPNGGSTEHIPSSGSSDHDPPAGENSVTAWSAPSCPGRAEDGPHSEMGKGAMSWRPFRFAALDALVLGKPEDDAYQRMIKLVSDVMGVPDEASPLTHEIDDLYWCFRKLQAYEAWAVHGAWISATDRGLDLDVRARFEFGATVDAQSMAAEAERRVAFRMELAERLGDDGILVLPTVPGAAPLRGASRDDLQAYRERALRLLCLAGLSGFPQITLPIGEVDGAPFGISLCGPAGSDQQLIGLARGSLERAAKG